MKLNKPLFMSTLTFLLILVSVLFAAYNIDGYRMTWPHFAAFVAAMGWYGSELNKEMNR